MKEINIDEKLAGQKMMRCLERYLSNAPKSFLYNCLLYTSDAADE